MYLISTILYILDSNFILTITDFEGTVAKPLSEPTLTNMFEEFFETRGHIDLIKESQIAGARY